MKIKKAISLILLLIVSAVIVASTFQNCAKVSYQDRETPTTGKQISNAVYTKTATINTAFNPASAEMKVLFVVDDSFTMSQSQTQLANALDTLLNPLAGRNVQFKIVSTSGIPSNQIDYSIQQKFYNSQNLEVSQGTAANLAEYSIINKVQNNSSNRHSELRSYKNYTTTQFDTTKQLVKNALLSVGTNGSDQEEGICAGVRQLFDTSENRFFYPGDKAAIIFLTDEDDASTFANCVSEYKQQYSSLPTVYYKYQQRKARLSLEYQVQKDGVTSWLPVSWSIPLNTLNQFNSGGNCSVQDQIIAESKIVDMGFTARNVSQCIYETEEVQHFGADLGDNGSNSAMNLCTSTVTVNGSSYTNFYNYITSSELSAVPGSCTKVSYPAFTIAPTQIMSSVISSDTVAHNLQDLNTAFINKANSLFGSGFIVATLIRQSSDGCTLQSGQNYGETYEQLAADLGVKAVTESLCASSFTDVLSDVSGFITQAVQSSYLISQMLVDEVVFSVTVKRGSTNIILTSEQYESVGPVITFSNFTIEQGDIIEVTFGK